MLPALILPSGFPWKVLTASGTTLIASTLSRLQPEIELFLWARRSGSWETIQMTDLQAFVQQLYRENPQLLEETIPDILSELELLLKKEHKVAQEREKALAAIRQEGAAMLHTLFDALGNEVPMHSLLNRYHLAAFEKAARESKGKAALPSEAQRAEAEATIRETVVDGEVFQLIPAKGARLEMIRRLQDAKGHTLQEATYSGFPDTDTSKLVSYVDKHPGTEGGTLRDSLGYSKEQQSLFYQVLGAALSKGEIRKEGKLRGTRYYPNKK